MSQALYIVKSSTTWRKECFCPHLKRRHLKLGEVTSLQVRQPVGTGLGLFSHQILPLTIPASGWSRVHTVQGCSSATHTVRALLCSLSSCSHNLNPWKSPTVFQVLFYQVCACSEPTVNDILAFSFIHFRCLLFGSCLKGYLTYICLEMPIKSMCNLSISNQGCAESKDCGVISTFLGSV